jgi:amino acid adenylation domain-containing protein
MLLLEKPQTSKLTIKDSYRSQNTRKNFIELFREQASKYPDQRIAIDRIGHITYEELNNKSDNLARFLVKSGIKPNDLVGLCSSLNIDFIISMLGIIKAGAAYFPLDHEYPNERLQHMVRDSNPTAILVEPQFSSLFKGNKVIEIEQKIFDGEYRLHNNLSNTLIQPENLAYVVYTSGSTGLPKGIMITHESLANVALAHREYYPPSMRMLISGGVCFDASLLVIFHALANNAPLYLFNYNIRDGVGDLLNFIQTNSIGFMICVPSQYLKLLQKNIPLSFLKCVSLTGENVSKSLCCLHAKLAANALLYNEYGPTEYAIGATIAKIYSPKSSLARQITVGNPLPNTQVYILDNNLNMLPKGTKGEIFIGGIGLAQGYINNEKLTDEKFIYVQSQKNEFLRLYRTGDIGRFLPNGELEFLGRVDHRVRICGNWVNLGEVEHHISNRSNIQESAVLLQNNSQGEKQLVIYITSLKKTAKSFLLRYLKALLPNRVPYSVIQINKFPLSPNGKIDRSALLSLHE